jgi:hypothetical protein
MSGYVAAFRPIPTSLGPLGPTCWQLRQVMISPPVLYNWSILIHGLYRPYCNNISFISWRISNPMSFLKHKVYKIPQYRPYCCWIYPLHIHLTSPTQKGRVSTASPSWPPGARNGKARCCRNLPSIVAQFTGTRGHSLVGKLLPGVVNGLTNITNWIHQL